MISAIPPLSTHNLGSVFALSKEDFKHINARVNSCIVSKNALEVVSKSLPPFRGAVTAAEDWRTALYPELVALARDLDTYAVKAIADFGSFNQKIDALGTHVDDLPPTLKEEGAHIIAALHCATVPIYLRFEKVTTGLFNFITANAALDDAMAQKKLGFKMDEIKANLTRLQQACAHVMGGWQGLYEELQNYTRMDTPIDMAFIAALEMNMAIVGWEKLRTQCVLFLNGG